MFTARFHESMNGTLFVLLIFACFMFGLYIAREIKRNGFIRARLQAAISIFVLMSGEAVIRGWIWHWRHLSNSGNEVAWMIQNPILLAGALIEILGVMCVIRVFAPDHWGRSVWIASSVLAVAIAAFFSSF